MHLHIHAFYLIFVSLCFASTAGIVPADFIRAPDERRYAAAAASASSSSERPIMALLVFGRDYEYKPEAFDSGRLPVTLSREMQMFLDVTNLIQCENPRAAYLCRQYAFEITWKLDHDYIGQGVRQFKTYLQNRLEQDNEITLFRRQARSDMRKLKRVYHAFKDYTIKNDGVVNEEKKTIAKRVAQAVFEEYKTITDASSTKTD